MLLQNITEKYNNVKQVYQSHRLRIFDKGILIRVRYNKLFLYIDKYSKKVSLFMTGKRKRSLMCIKVCVITYLDINLMHIIDIKLTKTYYFSVYNHATELTRPFLWDYKTCIRSRHAII